MEWGDHLCFGKLLKAQCYCSGLEVFCQSVLSSSEEAEEEHLFYALIKCKEADETCFCSFEFKSLMS